MWKKVLFLVVGILAVAVLVGSVVTSANADDATPANASNPPPPGGPRFGPPGGPRFGPPGGPNGSEIMDRVAQILNVDKQTLTDAFKQAQKESGQKRMDGMFAKLVTDGKLTQAQADQYEAWLSSKPADVPGFGFGDATKGNEMMSKLLTDGKITQAQYDAWKAWMTQKPNVELPRPERPAGGPPWGKPGAPK
jgi:major membrane immunogen (membrane-anchored lipoprotein)